MQVDTAALEPGVAADGAGRLLRAPTFARAPRCLAPCWQGARRGDNEDLEAHVNMMLNIFADAWRFQDMESDVWAQRLQKIGARFYYGAIGYASLCICLYTRP